MQAGQTSYLDRLHYTASTCDPESAHDSAPLVLPYWARFYGFIGEWIIRSRQDDRRLVVGLSVPTRAFCGALIATGAIAKLAALSENPAPPESEHFEELKALPTDTPVRIKNRKTNKYKNGLFIEYISDDPMYGQILKIQTTKGGAKSEPSFDIYTVKNCLEIEIIANESQNLPVNPASKPLDDGFDMWSSLLNADHVAGFYHNDSTECLVLGQPAHLEPEITNQKFSVPVDTPNNQPSIVAGEYRTGPLQSILRAQRFDKANSGHKSDVWSSRQLPSRINLMAESPTLVVFDGALEFTKWRHFFGQSNWAVILDRTEPKYWDAVRDLNDDFLHRLEDAEVPLERDCPKGSDIMAYYGGLT